MRILGRTFASRLHSLPSLFELFEMLAAEMRGRLSRVHPSPFAEEVVKRTREFRSLLRTRHSAWNPTARQPL